MGRTYRKNDRRWKRDNRDQNFKKSKKFKEFKKIQHIPSNNNNDDLYKKDIEIIPEEYSTDDLDNS